ncbi:sensor histidine kinase [Flaviflexus salsibiostraticola]|uniref:Oxygen sensor histidine kinase NreB n=1 Tax=Flaviflexus salsibiostraticola TaxID=1282737 RepID=A0A3Q8WTD9_9ACTO|nr:sensor histidine kinase [Flaviflexus salsibiostraticola]AZN29804.1 sensor histidine kinase [Flaviflexus salsibiostraticola]
MSLIDMPLTHTDTSAVARRTVGAMAWGQHLMAIALTLIGSIRAVGDGASLPAVTVAASAILVWHTAGTLLPAMTTRRRAIWWIIALTAIWIGSVAVSAEFVWLAFLLWLLAGHLLPLGWGVLYSGLVFAIVVIAPILHQGATSYANVLGPLIGGIFAFGISQGYLQLLRDATERDRLVSSLTRAQTEMAELQDELALAQRHSGAIAERTRLARDIHDTVAQALSSIRLLAYAGRTGDADEGRTLAQVEALAGESLADVRRIVAALAPTELEDDALASALQRMLDRVHDEAGLQVDLHVDDSLPLLPTEVEVALLRTAQSALANVRLHADAERVVVSLIDAEDSVRLDIIDDGSGFDVDAWEQDPAASSYGLRFMRARLRELGGGLDIESAPGEGTAISVHLPLRVDPTSARATAKEKP